MSSSINVYAVQVASFVKAFGSRNQNIIRSVAQESEGFFADIDAADDTDGISCIDCVTELIYGRISNSSPTYKYGCAFEAICEHLGEELPNICPIENAPTWLKKIDLALESKRLTLRLAALVASGSPIRIPQSNDYPFIGKWSMEEISRSRPLFETTDLTTSDPEITRVLQQIRNWLSLVQSKPGRGLIGFLV